MQMVDILIEYNYAFTREPEIQTRSPGILPRGNAARKSKDIGRAGKHF